MVANYSFQRTLIRCTASRRLTQALSRPRAGQPRVQEGAARKRQETGAGPMVLAPGWSPPLQGKEEVRRHPGNR